MYKFWGDRADTGLCELLWSIRRNCQLMAKFEMMHILHAQRCGCISVHPGLPHKKRNEKLVVHQNVSQIKQDEIGHFEI